MLICAYRQQFNKNSKCLYVNNYRHLEFLLNCCLLAQINTTYHVSSPCAGYYDFLFFPDYFFFHKSFLLRVIQNQDCIVKNWSNFSFSQNLFCSNKYRNHQYLICRLQTFSISSAYRSESMTDLNLYQMTKLWTETISRQQTKYDWNDHFCPW